jgi:phosphate transport system protein
VRPAGVSRAICFRKRNHSACVENPRNLTLCTHPLFCAKNIERMGDHATNIAETFYYMVQGRPLSKYRPKADVTSKGALPLPCGS